MFDAEKLTCTMYGYIGENACMIKNKNDSGIFFLFKSKQKEIHRSM
jgi:hypothetical protein